MELAGFDWDSGNEAKCQKHGVSVFEIEDIFARRVLILNDPHDAIIERRLRAIGATAEGRAVFVVFTLRGNRIRPLSARYMHKREVQRYEKDNPDV
jgi:uncharacterized protein